MKKKHLLEYLAKYPDDYEVCLSTYMQIPSEELDLDEDTTLEDEDFKIIVDLPIIGIAANDETQEIRFILDSDMECAEEVEDEITRLEDENPPFYIPEVQ